MIKIEGVSKKYGKNQVLKNINLNLEEGKVYGIVGENGAGKTTLFNCLVGLENYEGIIKSSFKNLKDHVGFLQTESHFFSKITGEEYIQFFANARSIEINNIEKKNIFDLPLSQYANGVDIQSNIIITEIIFKLKSLGKTILLSSHIFDTLAKTCDEIHVLDKGIFTKKVLQKDFANLEMEMKKNSVANKIDKLF